MRRNNKVWILFLFAGLVCFSVRPVWAMTVEKRFSIMPLVGIQSGFRFGDLIPLPQTADVPDIKILLEHKSPAGGMGFGYQISRRIEFQVAALCDQARIMNDVGIGLAGVPLGKVELSAAILYSLCGRLLYHFPLQRFSPYIAVGGGAAILDTEQVGSKTKPYVRLGAGVTVRLTECLRAVLDIQDSITFFRFDRDFKFQYVQIYAPDFRRIQHSTGLFVGLGYVF